MSQQEIYESLFDRFIAEHDDVQPGLMMREPALKCGGKVFAFYYQDKTAMCFKLGKNFNLKVHGIDTFSLLSPFKNKPPMAAWFIIDDEYFEKWDTLTKLALDGIRK